MHDADRFVEGHPDAEIIPVGNVRLLPEMPRLTDPRGTPAWTQILEDFSRQIWPAHVPPIVVMPLDADEEVALIDGRMRFAAAIMRGIQAVPCKIVRADERDAPFLWRYFVMAIKHRPYIPPIELLVWMAQVAPFRPSIHIYPPPDAECDYDQAVQIAQRLSRDDMIRVANMDESAQRDFIRRAVAALQKEKRGD